MLRTHSIQVTTSGGAGTSTGTGTITGITAGRVVAVSAAYGSQPATTDVDLVAITPSGAERSIITLTNSNTDVGLTNLVNDPIDEAGAAVTGVEAAPFILGGSSIRVDVAQADDAGTVDVDVVTEDGNYQRALGWAAGS